CNVGFNVEEVEGVNAYSSLFRDGERRYSRFMRRLHELQMARRKIHIREFEHARFAILQAPTGTGQYQAHPNHQVTPFGIVSVDCDGNFSTFSPELLGQRAPEYGDFAFGNVRTDSLASAAALERFRRIESDIRAGVERCRQTCQYFGLCGGGAPANKFYEH